MSNIDKFVDELVDELIDKYLINEGLASIENLNDDIQILRTVIYAEADAANLYVQMANKAKNPKVKALLLDIAKEEDIHLYEAKALLETIYPDIEYIKTSAEKEVKEKFK